MRVIPRHKPCELVHWSSPVLEDTLGGVTSPGLVPDDKWSIAHPGEEVHINVAHYVALFMLLAQLY